MLYLIAYIAVLVLTPKDFQNGVIASKLCTTFTFIDIIIIIVRHLKDIDEICIHSNW